MTTPLENLTKHPEKFRFDAAVRILLAAAGPGHGEDRVRFIASPSLAQPAAEVTAAQAPNAEVAARLTTPLIGLTGVSGVMPRWYTDLVAQAVRARSRSIVDFFDLIAQRLITAFAQSGMKYRLHRSSETAVRTATEEPIGAGLLALTGYGTARLADRLSAGPDVLRHYSGFFAVRPRSAERLRSMISDYLGRDVQIREFAGAWLTVPPDQQSRLPRGRVTGAFNALGRDAAIGTRAWDQQARFILRIGPLNLHEFEALLPDRQNLPALVSLIRAYVGWEADFAINLVLSALAIPPFRMAEGSGLGGLRLGWTTWLPSGTGALTGRMIADDALFGATLVESLKS